MAYKHSSRNVVKIASPNKSSFNYFSRKNKFIGSSTKYLVLVFIIFSLAACSSDDDEGSTGYIKFYNVSPDSPSIYLTLDEDLDNDPDDEFEQTFSPIAYGKAGSRVSLDSGSYFYELAYQDEDSSARGDLEIVAEGELRIPADSTLWIVMNNSVESPSVVTFTVPILSDDQTEQDSEDDVFNLRFVNLTSLYPNVDVYISEADETFNEAELVSSLSLETLSENYRLTKDQYKFYITLSGETEVLFTSDEINYAYGGQFLLAIRENSGNGGSPFVLDSINNTTITQFDALESLANIAVYNGLSASELVSDYSQDIDIQITGKTEIDPIEALGYGSFSESFAVESGDYRFNVLNHNNDQAFLENRVLSLAKNTDKTLFLYWTEDPVDDDNDGNIDENEDGIVDELRAVVSSLVIENSNRSRLYDKEIKLLNLVSSDDFTSVTFYFVKDNEIIDSAESHRSLGQGGSSSLILRNNTY